MVEHSLGMDSGMSWHRSPLRDLVDLGKSDTGADSLDVLTPGRRVRFRIDYLC
jgi:hypothetical protein